MDVYIHIGYPKTGSTAIQSHVFTNRGWLKKRGIYVPQAGYAGGFGHSHLLPTSFIAPISFGEKPGPTALELLARELSEAQANGFERCLITWEGFADKNEDELKPFGEALRNHRVIVLAYVREHAELFQSIVLQDLEILRFDRGKSIFDRTNMFDHMDRKFDYGQTLGLWKNVFQPNGEVRTRIYRRSRLLETNVVIDFFQWLGLKLDETFCLQSGSVNPSLDCRAGGFLATAQVPGLNHVLLQPLVKALVSVVSEEGAQSKEFLSSEEVDQIDTFYSESTSRLFAEFRPENTEKGETGFPKKEVSTRKEESQSTADWLHSVYRAVHNPRVPLWQGNVLTSYNLGKVVSPPSSGWRGPEEQGIWTVGARSEIRFHIPQVDRVEGPRAINMVLAGHYHGKNTSTKVAVGDRQEVANLARFEFQIEIDTALQDKGVLVVLEHEHPTLVEPEQVDAAVDGIAFKLQFMSYDFVWE